MELLSHDSLDLDRSVCPMVSEETGRRYQSLLPCGLIGMKYRPSNITTSDLGNYRLCLQTVPADP
jgi:hypothetical protein